MEAEEGDGSDTTMYFYYNGVEDRCVPFKYSGQGGNRNRFSNERHCMRNCSANAENVYPIDGKKFSIIHKGQNEMGFCFNEHCVEL